MFPLKRYQNREHTDRVFAETARRLGFSLDELMALPVIEIAKMMVDQEVSMGLQAVK